MVIVTVGFIAGIGSSTDKIDSSLSEYYKSANVSDFIVKSKNDAGFSDGDKDKMREKFGADNVFTLALLDVPSGEKRSVRYCFSDGESGINKAELIEGELPADKTQILAEWSDNIIKPCLVGDKITLDFKDMIIKSAEANGKEVNSSTRNLLDRLKSVEVTVSGIVQSPLTFALDGEPSNNNPEDAEIPDDTSGTKDMDVLESVYYLSSDIIPTYKDIMPFLEDKPIVNEGDMWITLTDRELFDSYSRGYEKRVNAVKSEIEGELENVRVLTLHDNYSFKSLNSYSDKVEKLGYVLMAAFLAVTALVVLSNMTRFLEEERSQIACLKTLGFSSFSVISKYMLFAFLATLLGGGIAYFVGVGLADLIYFVFNFSFAMPPMAGGVAMINYVITFAAIVAVTTLVTAVSGLKLAGERPANLLRPKPPKAGKKVILEKIPFIWNRLSFKHKSTMRNVLRYKSRFFMTVVAVAVSTALVMAGFAVLDLCLFGDLNMPSIMAIAVVVEIFAGLLTGVVVYTLTNINISERNREIATLMVLGYQDKEVTGYIYREVYVNTTIGILVGYPVAALLVWFLFWLLGFGSLGGVSWFWWLVAPFVVFAFTAIVTVLLRRKIVKIDMNESLKAIE